MSSFQGPGTGISGTSNQFTAGYSQSAGYSNSYANYAGNVNGYAPAGGYANQGAATAANIQSSNGINGTSWAWAGQAGTPSWLWGSNDGNNMAVWGPNQMYVGSAGYANQAAQTTNQVANSGMATYAQTLRGNYSNSTFSSTWAWAGQAGTPGHLWGSNDGNNMWVWGPNQMYMGSAPNATTAGNCQTATSAQSWLSTNISNTLNQGYYNIGGATQVGFYASGGGNFGIAIQGVGTTIVFLGYQGQNTDRFRVYYLPEQNSTQWGAFSNAFYQNSDVRDKEQIEDLNADKCREFIKQLRPRKYKWKNVETHAECDQHDRVGFIAQEVLSAASNVEDTSLYHIINHGDQYLEAGGSLDTENFDYEASNNTPTLGISLEQLTSPLVKAVQGVMEDIESLKIRITALKQKFNIQ